MNIGMDYEYQYKDYEYQYKDYEYQYKDYECWYKGKTLTPKVQHVPNNVCNILQEVILVPRFLTLVVILQYYFLNT